MQKYGKKIRAKCQNECDCKGKMLIENFSLFDGDIFLGWKGTEQQR